ncbi:MAG TPA: M50 family metallopeptidase [Gaiellaceae bacterium]|jgi:Zn-dependent protease|nr:M50 family metallopeptidase [Gaiellaceae bacterium]
MSPYLWLSVWFAMLAASLVAHEAGHVVVGRRNGWDYAGFTMKLTGPKVLMGHSSPDRKDWNLGLVALAGPLATLTACTVFIGLAYLPIQNAWIFESLAAVNFAIFVINLLPLPITDGGHILYAVTGWRMSWGRAAAGWMAVEALIVLGFALRALFGS